MSRERQGGGRGLREQEGARCVVPVIYLPGATNPGLAGLIVKSECTGEGAAILITGGCDIQRLCDIFS